jgi:lipoprotein signal peptidase
MTHRSYRGLLWTLAVLGLLLDQGTKYGMFRWLYAPTYERRHEVFGKGFEFIAQFTGEPLSGGWRWPFQSLNGPVKPRVNEGALFGVRLCDLLKLGPEYGWLDNAFFAAVSVTAAVAIAAWSWRRHTAKDRWLCASLGLILAGTLGNLFDRVVFGGVRDFLYYHHWFEWPVFNVADCFLVCGAGLLLLLAFTSSADDMHKVPEPATAAVAD